MNDKQSSELIEFLTKMKTFNTIESMQVCAISEIAQDIKKIKFILEKMIK